MHQKIRLTIQYDCENKNLIHLLILPIFCFAFLNYLINFPIVNKILKNLNKKFNLKNFQKFFI